MTTTRRLYDSETVALSTGAVHLYRGGAGAPLVVLHHDIGTPGWLPFYDRLAQDFTVYVPELPGYGRSASLDWARHPRDMAAVLQQLLDRLDLDLITLVGLGFGGWLAAEMAVVNQRRLRRLVLLGAMGLRPPDAEILDQFMVAADEYARRGFQNQAVFEMLYTNEPSAEQQLAWDLNREVVARLCWKPYMISYQLPALLTGLTAPTLLIWGSGDEIVPLSAGRRYAELIPGARLEVVDGAGHFAEMEQPEKVAALVTSFAT
jgi:pimeloyl-ACP methyl ester carboxylesterase